MIVFMKYKQNVFESLCRITLNVSFSVCRLKIFGICLGMHTTKNAYLWE